MKKHDSHPSAESAAFPPLLFGEGQAHIKTGFHGMVDQFAHLTPGCDYDSKAKNGFRYKGNVLDIDGLVVNQNYYSHMLAVSAVRSHNLLIPLAGTHYGLFQGSQLTAHHEQGFFIPANDRFQFETGVTEIAGSLIITFDLERLNLVMQTMTGNVQDKVCEMRVRHLPLRQGTVNFKQLFLALFAQVDGLGGDLELLRLNAFTDQFYRLLALSLRPEYFLNRELTDSERRAIRASRVMTAFERYIDDHIEQPITLSELEAVLGVTARALQYACLKRHGCTPRAFIRNKILERAYARLMQQNAPVKLATLAFELGFSSQSQFAKFFRERFGVLPSELVAKQGR